jgi:hypothetical protein
VRERWEWRSLHDLHQGAERGAGKACGPGKTVHNEPNIGGPCILPAAFKRHSVSVRRSVAREVGPSRLSLDLDFFEGTLQTCAELPHVCAYFPRPKRAYCLGAVRHQR